MYTLQRLLMLSATLLFMSGCGARHAKGEHPLPSTPARLQVENHNWLDVVVYLRHDGQRTRLGSATAAKTTDFTLAPALLGQLGAIQLVADPIGSRGGITTQTIVVKPGTRVVWTLETDLSRSSIAVY